MCSTASIFLLTYIGDFIRIAVCGVPVPFDRHVVDKRVGALEAKLEICNEKINYLETWNASNDVKLVSKVSKVDNKNGALENQSKWVGQCQYLSLTWSTIPEGKAARSLPRSLYDPLNSTPNSLCLSVIGAGAVASISGDKPCLEEQCELEARLGDRKRDLSGSASETNRNLLGDLLHLRDQYSQELASLWYECDRSNTRLVTYNSCNEASC